MKVSHGAERKMVFGSQSAGHYGCLNFWSAMMVFIIQAVHRTCFAFIPYGFRTVGRSKPTSYGIQGS
jgi:hypothetical protein